MRVPFAGALGRTTEVKSETKRQRWQKSQLEAGGIEVRHWLGKTLAPSFLPPLNVKEKYYIFGTEHQEILYVVWEPHLKCQHDKTTARVRGYRVWSTLARCRPTCSCRCSNVERCTAFQWQQCLAQTGGTAGSFDMTPTNPREVDGLAAASSQHSWNTQHFLIGIHAKTTLQSLRVI